MPECPDCRSGGWIREVRDGVSGMKRCDCRTKRIAAERIRDVLEHWPAYADADLDEFEPRNDAQAAAITAILKRPTGS